MDFLKVDKSDVVFEEEAEENSEYNVWFSKGDTEQLGAKVTRSRKQRRENSDS